MHKLTLAGRINLHRTQSPSEYHEQSSNAATHQPWNKYTQSASGAKSTWTSPRVAPYSTGRGRAGRTAANPHRNRTLVLNNKVGTSTQLTKDPRSEETEPNSEAIKANPEDGPEFAQQPTGWVTKRDRHMQLINSSIYDKETQLRNKAIEETRKQKSLRRDQREKQKIQKHLKTLSAYPDQSKATPTAHELLINGLRFHVLDGGSKLARIRGEGANNKQNIHLSLQHIGAADSASTTPKQATIGGVTFLRSKNGNLYRSGIVKAKKSVHILIDVPTTGTYYFGRSRPADGYRASTKFKKISEPCKRFSLTGTLSFTPSSLQSRAEI